MGPNENFWEHEWTKHGTCAQPLLGNRTTFVHTVLDLHEKYNLDVALGDAGVYPSASTTYDPEDVVEAVRDAHGVIPRLSCTAGVLVEIWMCMGLDLTPVNCPPSVQPGPKCHGSIRLPPGGDPTAACRPYFPPWDGEGEGGGGGDDPDADSPSWRVAVVLLAALAAAYAAVYFVQRMLATREESEEQAMLLNGEWHTQGDLADP